MKKFLPIFLMAFLACTSAQSCNNPLMRVFNITGLSAPASAEGLAYCQNTQSGQTCCSNSTIVGLQETLTELTNTLQALAGERDIYIAQLDHNYTSEFRDKVSDLTDLTDEIGDIQNANAVVGDPIHTQFLSLRQLGDNLISNDDDFKKDFVDMQNKRVICFNALLQIQSEAYCLACDPDWASQGVFANGTINSAPAVCQIIQDSCAPYTAAMDKFNPFFQAQQAYQRLVNLIDYLKVFREHHSIINSTISNDIPVFTNATERTNSQPANCNGDNTCEWQCQNLFSRSFVMNTTVVANGAGLIGGGDVAYPNLGVVQVPAEGASGVGANDSARLLQSTTTGTWNPDLSSSGMEFTVIPDPASVTNLDGSSASDADIDPHLGGSRTGFGLALIAGLVFAIMM